MAQALGHKWGQIIGELLEEANKQLLQELAHKHKLYFDCAGFRPGRKEARVAWKDRYGNTHLLDYVLERGGTKDSVGLPVAFIESAWRRYTKHSKNKAQEIEAALLPLAETYSHCQPFLGAILAGVFTEGALKQLRSKGFVVLYFNYDSINAAFQSVGIDSAYEEDTADDEFEEKIDKWSRLRVQDKKNIIDTLLASQRTDIETFYNKVSVSLSRKISSVALRILHGKALVFQSVEEALGTLTNYDEASVGGLVFVRYEIEICYDNTDCIKASFKGKSDAAQFLRTFLPL